MPLKIGDQTYAGFDEAVNAVMKKKKISREAAKRYVGSIQAKQEK
jgi:hypothetical protein